MLAYIYFYLIIFILGTGKTLCLLASSLAWLLNQKKTEPCRIIYTSRTHSQLTQAIRELKNSDYAHLKAVVLGSRDQLCINEDLFPLKGPERNNTCRNLLKRGGCSYEKRALRPEQNVNDIEDLVTLGTQCSICPYYLAKDLAIQADIIFMPYNYLLDSRIHRSLKINLINSVVIFDEAHNLEKTCEETGSTKFGTVDINNCLNDIKNAMTRLNINEFLIEDEDGNDFTRNVQNIQSMMFTLKNEVDKIDVDPNEGRTLPGTDIFSIFGAASITKSSYPMIRKILDKLYMLLTSTNFCRRGTGLLKMTEVLDIIFNGDMDIEYQKNGDIGYKVHVENEFDQKRRNVTKILNYWCFNPAFVMNNLMKCHVRSVILTSGTLAPLTPLINELGLNFKYRLKNPHIIKSNQLFVKIINVGPDKESLVGTYQNRNNQKYINSMGKTIIEISRVTPNGVLIFFSSYVVMNNFIDTWKNTNIWQLMNDTKPVLIEPREQSVFDETIATYYDHAKTDKGGILMAVLKGSETSLNKT